MCLCGQMYWAQIKQLEFIAVEPISPAILTGTQVEFGTSVATAGKGGRICS